MIDEIHIQFQGGFAGRDCQVEGLETQEIGYKTLMEFYPEDNNSLQVSFFMRIYCTDSKSCMDGWMTCNFMSFSTVHVFQLYQDNSWLII